MTPEYLRELADLADPDQLWRLPLTERLDMSFEKKRQLDMGIALRRHAAHVETLNLMIGSNRSLLITPLSVNGVATKRVPTPEDHLLLIEARDKAMGSDPQLN